MPIYQVYSLREDLRHIRRTVATAGSLDNLTRSVTVVGGSCYHCSTTEQFVAMSPNLTRYLQSADQTALYFYIVTNTNIDIVRKFREMFFLFYFFHLRICVLRVKIVTYYNVNQNM